MADDSPRKDKDVVDDHDDSAPAAEAAPVEKDADGKEAEKKEGGRRERSRSRSRSPRYGRRRTWRSILSHTCCFGTVARPKRVEEREKGGKVFLIPLLTSPSLLPPPLPSSGAAARLPRAAGATRAPLSAVAAGAQGVALLGTPPPFLVL